MQQLNKVNTSFRTDQEKEGKKEILFYFISFYFPLVPGRGKGMKHSLKSFDSCIHLTHPCLMRLEEQSIHICQLNFIVIKE